MPLMKQIYACALAATLGGCAYTAMPNMRGSVIDVNTKRPISGATVDVIGRDGVEEHVITDTNGRFALRGAVHNWGPPLRTVPKLDFRVSAPCYLGVEMKDHFPSYNIYDPPTILPIELSPICKVGT